MFWFTDHGDPSIVVHRISESEIQKLYSTDDRLNHVTKTRFLKSRKDRQMHYTGQMIGMNLVYQNGRSPGGTRTNWEMKEYRLVRDDVDQVGVAQAYFLPLLKSAGVLAPTITGCKWKRMDFSNYGFGSMLMSLCTCLTVHRDTCVRWDGITSEETKCTRTKLDIVFRVLCQV